MRPDRHRDHRARERSNVSVHHPPSSPSHVAPNFISGVESSGTKPDATVFPSPLKEEGASTGERLRSSLALLTLCPLWLLLPALLNGTACSHEPLRPAQQRSTEAREEAAILIEPETIHPGETVQLTDVRPVDPDAPALLYSWMACAGAIESGMAGAHGPAATWTAPTQPGSYAVTVTTSVFSSTGWERDARVIRLCVGGDCEDAINANPQLTEVSANPSEFNGEGTPTLVALAADPDGDPLIYKWTARQGDLDSPESSSTQWKLPPIGCCTAEYVASVTVCDDKGGAAADLAMAIVYAN